MIGTIVIATKKYASQQEEDMIDSEKKRPGGYWDNVSELEQRGAKHDFNNDDSNQNVKKEELLPSLPLTLPPLSSPSSFSSNVTRKLSTTSSKVVEYEPVSIVDDDDQFLARERNKSTELNVAYVENDNNDNNPYLNQKRIFNNNTNSGK